MNSNQSIIQNIPKNLILNVSNKHFETICRVDSNELLDQTILTTSFNNKNKDIKNMLDFSISNHSSLINSELNRKEIFEIMKITLISFIKKIIPEFNDKDIFKMIQMYLLNKIIFRNKNDDYVIVSTSSSECNEQLLKNLRYKLIEYKVKLSDQNKILDKIKDKFESTFKSKGSLLAYNYSFISDGEIKKNNQIFQYSVSIKNNENDSFELVNVDIPITKSLLPMFERYKEDENITDELVKKYIMCYLRYSYLDLNTLALAFDYSHHPLTKDLNKYNTLEAFASLFNFYYPNWCSAFHDIEDIFGSKGSFFDLESKEILKYDNVVINPPYDELTITKTLMKVDDCIIEKRKNPLNITRFIIIICNWDDLSIIKDFKLKYPFTVYQKGEITFIDYFKKDKTSEIKFIKPCDIVIFDLK